MTVEELKNWIERIDDDGTIHPAWLTTLTVRKSHNGWPILYANGEVIGSLDTICFTFFRGRPPKSLVCHHDGDPCNNSKDNLFEAHELREARKDPFYEWNQS